MSLTRPKPSRFQRYLAHEQQRLEAMSWGTFGLLLASSIPLVLLDPLLIPVAYVLQLWAATWNWRDRWASLHLLTRRGLILVSLFYLVAILDLAHLWFIQDLVGPLQTLWSAHLPGELSLVPILGYSLLARCLLLLPLAPAVTTLYEYINPQANPRLRRVLQASDIAEAQAEARKPKPPQGAAAPSAKTAQKAAGAAPSPAQAETQPGPSTSQPPPPVPKRVPHKPGQKSTPPLHRKASSQPQQMTIESFIEESTPTQPPGSTPAAPVTPAAPHTPAQSPGAPNTKQSAPKKQQIDWLHTDE